MNLQMPKYKLNYFNAQGLVEPIRFMFVLAYEPFIDNRIEEDETWESTKSEYLWEKLPCLEVDGIVISQTLSIARFVARRFGLVGKNEFEATRCDEIIDALSDFRTEWMKWDQASEAGKPIIMDQLMKTHVPNYFKKLNGIVKNNTTGNGWIVGESITWADLYIAYFFVTFHNIAKANVLDSYKYLKQLTNQVFEFATIAEYVKTRPDTPPTLN